MDWQKTKEETYKLDFRTVAKWRFILPDGKESDYDIILGPDVAVTVALTPNNQVILAGQYRPGPQKYLWELPAGLIDEGETPIMAAGRELKEEVGYEGELKYAGYTYQGGYSTVKIHSFLAVNCRKVTQHQNLDHNEFIDPKLIPLHEFRQLLKSGQLTDVGPAYMALDHLGLLA